MADDIHYDYHTIEQALDDINQQIRSANTLKADVADIFNKMQPHYEGEAGRELQAQHRLIDGKMEELLADLTQSQQEAEQQKEHMQMLDAKLAQGMGSG